MIVLNCPRCSDPVRLPTLQPPADAQAQCPWCLETFPVAEVLGKLPPPLQLISSDGQPLQLAPAAEMATAEMAPAALAGVGSGTAGGGFGVADPTDPTGYGSDAADTDKWDEELSTAATADSWDSGNDDTTAMPASGLHVELDGDDGEPTWDGAQAATEPAFAPMNVQPSPTRKKKGSPIRSVIGVVLGGLLALPIAGLLLMLVGRTPDLGFWPFLGETPAPSSFSAAPPAALANDDLGPPPAAPSGRSLLTPEMESSLDPEDPAATALAELQGGTDTQTDPASSAGDPPLETTAGEPAEQADPVNESPADVALPAEMNSDPTDSVDSAVATDTPSNQTTPESPAEPADRSEDVAMNAAQPAESPQPESPPAATPPSETPENDPIAMTAPVTETTPSAETTAPAETPAPANAELSRTVQQATEMLGKIASFDGSEAERRVLKANAYMQLAKLGELIQGDEAVLPSLFEQIKSSPMLTDLPGAGQQWLGHPRRTTPGILLIGRTDDQGASLQFETGENVTLSGIDDLPTAQRTMVLGKVLQAGEQPAVEVVYAEALP